jgi:hypothetical protein
MTSPQVIYLDPEDDLVSIRDRLSWAREKRVLLVLPDGKADLLHDWLDLKILRRHVDDLRLEVGLVTLDRDVRPQAQALGFPLFHSARAGQEANDRAWRKGQRRKYEWSRPRGLDQDDRREIARRMAPPIKWSRWLLRYLGIFLFFLTVAVVYVAAAWTIPGATITLKPQVSPISVSRQIVADPQLDSVNASGASVPARVLVVVAEWQANVETTGTLEVPDALARGKVIFINRIPQEVSVPAGTRVSTSAGARVVYQTLTDVTVPGVIGATTEVDVLALEPGLSGNVEANQINRIEGLLTLQLEVRNLDPLEGGGVRTARAVASSDQERLRAQVIQQLQSLALAEMEVQLTESEFLARDSLRIVTIYDETFTAFVGEQADNISLEIRAELHATAVDETKATGLVYEALIAAVSPEFELVPDSLNFYSGEVTGVDSQGRVSFAMIGEGLTAARLDVETNLAKIAGQKTDDGLAFLYETLPLREYPTVRVIPDWFGRLPYLPTRMQVQIETS